MSTVQRNVNIVRHPPCEGVDWNKLNRSQTGRERVLLTCPICGIERWADSGSVRFRILRGKHTSLCKKDRCLGRSTKPKPEHPAVNWTPVIVGRSAHCTITCLQCGNAQTRQANQVSYKVKRGTFTGICAACSGKVKKRDWVILGPGRRIDPNKGYVRIGLAAIDDSDRFLFYGMKGSGTTIGEHRFVMAKMLGRPITSEELVDHMDGDKTNNDPGNLRIYVRGKNQPGDIPGYGIFYHEWQIALARIRELESQIAA